MKKLAVIFYLLYSLPLCAQRGLYITPHAGIGRTDISYRATGFIGGFNQPPRDPGLSFAAGIDAGYQSGRWQFQTGLGLIRTGYQNLIRLYDYDPLLNSAILIDEGALHYRYMHILLPLAAGYSLPVGKRLHFEPFIGADLSYNAGETRKLVLKDHNSSVHEPNDSFYHYRQRFSVFGRGSLLLRYDLSGRLGIQAGLTGRYMLNNFIKNDAIAPGSAVYQHPWLITFDAGIRYSLHKKKQ